MEVVLAESAGFCFGVKRAIDEVYSQIEKHPDIPIYTYGPIIHNTEVIRDLKEKGVHVVDTVDELKKIQKGIVIIRSHGVSRNIYETLKGLSVECVDTTCPFVKKIHKIVEEEKNKGSYIVIIGNKDHPEVMGICGWAGEDVSVIETPKEAEMFQLHNPQQKVCVVSQTTFNYTKFKELVEILREKEYDIITMNTICNATKVRQEEAQSIADSVDAMIVIGDEHSSNTQKLFMICKNACVNTYYIQTLKDLDLNQLRSVERVGITAGASTPNKIIEEVQRNVRINF